MVHICISVSLWVSVSLNPVKSVIVTPEFSSAEVILASHTLYKHVLCQYPPTVTLEKAMRHALESSKYEASRD